MPQILPLPGGSVVLPDYARPDLAFQQTFVIPLGSQNNFARYTVPANYIDIVVGAQLTMVTDATAGTRYAELFAQDANGLTLWDMPSNNGINPSGGGTTYWSAFVGAPWVAPLAFNNVMPVPALPVLPGSLIQMQMANSAGPSDRLSTHTITVIRVLSGPYQDAAAPPAILPTPVLA